MQHTVIVDAELDGTVESIWAVLADMPGYATWDPRAGQVRLDGPFATGTTGHVVSPAGKGSSLLLSDVVPGERWTSELPLPGGRLVMTYVLAQVGPGRVRVTKTYVAHGPVSIAFRVWYARAIRAELPATFAALEVEAARRIRS
jgi:polyketide cyclase/dehydrase/lipid transport protein